MAICSYLVIPESGATDALAARLRAQPGCDVARALNRDVLVLVTDTMSAAEETALRETIERMDGIRALILTFGEIDRDAPASQPAPGRGKRRRALPIVEPGELRSLLDASRGPAQREP